MDFARSCYTTEFRFYRDRPDVKVPVAWYFVPVGTPSLPEGTIFASRNWETDKYVEWPMLGEVQGSVRAWRDGSAPPAALSRVACGPSAALLHGESAPPNPPIACPLWGIPPCCFGLPPTGCPLLIDCDLTAPQMLWALSKACWAAQVQNGPILNAIGNQLVHLAAPNHTYTSSSLFRPSYAAWWDSRQALVAIGGTTDPGQLFLQALLSTLGLQDCGGFSAGVYWKQAAEFIAADMYAAGLPLNVPIVFTGYSLGGAVAPILTATEKILRPGRRTRCITFAAPKVGDSRLAFYAGPATTRIVTDGDIVPLLPPDFLFWAWAAPLVTFPVLFNWSTFLHPSGSILYHADGTFERDPLPPSAFSELLGIIQDVLLSNPLYIPAFHAISTYAERIGFGADAAPPYLPSVCLNPTTLAQIDSDLAAISPPPMIDVPARALMSTKCTVPLQSRQLLSANAILATVGSGNLTPGGVFTILARAQLALEGSSNLAPTGTIPSVVQLALQATSALVPITPIAAKAVLALEATAPLLTKTPLLSTGLLSTQGSSNLRPAPIAIAANAKMGCEGSSPATWPGSQRFDASGSFVVPSAVSSLSVKAWGAGGGGSTDPFGNTWEGAGGGGAFAWGTVSVTAGSTYPVTVGLGGADNADGGTSYFDSGADILADNGKADTGMIVGSAGQGGHAASCNGNIQVQNGGNGAIAGSPIFGPAGGGGGCGGDLGDGSDGSGSSGGASAGGEAGAGGDGATSSGSNGGGGNEVGGGGGGGADSFGVGGHGADGLVIVYW